MNEGLTLIEIVIVLVIIGTLVVIALPSYINSQEVSKAQSAENNLLAVAAAQSKFYEDYNSFCSSQAVPIATCFCVNTGTNPTGFTAVCGDSGADLSANLHLNLSTGDPFFANYQCAVPLGGDPAGTLYRCTTNDGTDTLTLLASATANTVTCTPVGSKCPS